MSSITQAAVRRLATVSRTSFATTAPRATFVTTARLNKAATESVKDGLKKVDRAVSDKIVDGIDAAAAVGNKVKEAGNEVSSGKATGKAEQYRHEAEGKASELAGEAKGKTSELAGKAKGKAEEVKGKLS